MPKFRYQKIKLTSRGPGEKEFYKYILLQDVCVNTKIKPNAFLKVPGFINLAPSGNLKINTGYSWNGASGIPDTKANMFAALVHDALYQLMREYHCKAPDSAMIDGILRTNFRLAADKLFCRHYKQNGGWQLWITLVFGALRICGESSTLCGGGSAKKKGKSLLPIQRARASGSVPCPQKTPQAVQSNPQAVQGSPQAVLNSE